MKLYTLKPADKTDPAFLYIAECLNKAVKQLRFNTDSVESIRELKNGLFRVKSKAGNVNTFYFSADGERDFYAERNELLRKKQHTFFAMKIDTSVVVLVGATICKSESKQAETARK